MNAVVTSYADRLKSRNVLTDTDIRRFAPSVFVDQPRSDVSENYKFIPTIEVIDSFREAGFAVVQAGQSKARAADKKLYTKHLVRFRANDQLEAKADLTPEILLVNSHDRTTGFQLKAGIFRLVCSNGLIVCDRSYGSYSFRHSGDAIQKAVDAIANVSKLANEAIERAREMSKITVTVDQQFSFAREAAKLRYKDNGDLTLLQGLLTPRRPAEVGYRSDMPKADLFTTVNVVQENLMHGKIQRTLASGRKSSTHAVNSVQADLTINTGIWTLAERFAKEVA